MVGAVALAGLMLAIEMQREAAPVEAKPEPAVATATRAPEPPVLPDIAPPVPAEELTAEEELAPVAIDVSENLSEATKLYNAGQYKKSISVLEQVVADDPKSVAAWNLLGLAKYDSLDSAGARAAADKVLELDPKNARVQILLATLHFDANEKDLARAALQKYLELAPNGPEVAEVQALLKR